MNSSEDEDSATSAISSPSRGSSPFMCELDELISFARSAEGYSTSFMIPDRNPMMLTKDAGVKKDSKIIRLHQPAPKSNLHKELNDVEQIDSTGATDVGEESREVNWTDALHNNEKMEDQLGMEMDVEVGQEVPQSTEITNSEGDIFGEIKILDLTETAMEETENDEDRMGNQALLMEFDAGEEEAPTEDNNYNELLGDEVVLQSTETTPNDAMLPEGEEVTALDEPNMEMNTKAHDKRLKAKLARLKGEAYTGFRRVNKKKTTVIKQDCSKSKRVMGVGCEQKKCAQWPTRKCHEITEQDREENFNIFWKELSWEKKKIMVCSLVIRKVLEGEGPTSRRKMSYFYHLRRGKKIVQVCRKMFLDTLGIGEGMLKRWLTCPGRTVATTVPAACPEQESSTSGSKHLSVRITHAQQFLKSIPTIPSHYCRKTSSKVYLQGDIPSKQNLYDLYKGACMKDGLVPLGRTKFVQLTNQANIGIFKPRKDQCDLCVMYQNKNASEEIYLKHLGEKDLARKEKEDDKAAAVNDKQCHVLTCDVMNVQCVPFIRASAAYYKLKLTTHNFTIYNLETRDAMNFWWDETMASLEASTYASCLTIYIEELVEKEYRPTVIVFSDGCTAQNRNAILANALLHLSARLHVKIIQKYLIKGHTQMEVDSVHATVEAAIRKQNVYLPSSMLTITELARKAPHAPYRATYLDPNMVKDFSKAMVYPSIRPGSKKDDPVLTHVHWLEYDGEKSLIKYKLNFDDELRPLPRRPLIRMDPQNPFCFPPKRLNKIPIAYDKWQDLQSLMPMIPQDCHPFYTNLPFLPESIRLKRRTERNNENKKKELKETKTKKK